MCCRLRQLFTVFFHQHDLMNKAEKKEDRRKYEAEHPNDIWQSDVMHGPHLEIDGKKRKTYLIAFIDDHSRLIIYGRFLYVGGNVGIYACP